MPTQPVDVAVVKTSWFLVYHPKTGRLMELLNKDETCHPYAGGDYQGHCGGCDSCMLMQATHNGCKVERLELEPGETVGDGLGRTHAAMKENPGALISYEKNEHDTWSDVYGRRDSKESSPP